MKSTGIVRELDQLGRIVLPIELRRVLHIDLGDSLEIFTDNRSIVFKKYAPGCLFCGTLDEMHYFKGKLLCMTCVSEMAEL